MLSRGSGEQAGQLGLQLIELVAKVSRAEDSAGAVLDLEQWRVPDRRMASPA